MQGIWNDIGYAFRRLRQSPGFTLTVVLTLALGVGVTTAALAIVDSVLLRSLALPHPEQLVSFQHFANGKTNQEFEHEDLDLLRSGTSAFSAIAATSGTLAPVTAADGSRVADNDNVSPSFFTLAGAAPLLGRVLTEADAHAPVAVVNYQFWRERLGARPDAVGTMIKVRGRLTTVVGVMPEGFSLPEGIKVATVFTPLVFNAKGEDQNGFTGVGLLGRLNPGVTMAAAQAQAQIVYGHSKPIRGEARGTLSLRSYQSFSVQDERPALLAILGACTLLLLLACINTANLQIARGLNRSGEMRARSALGASRFRLCRQIVTESLVVSLIGASLGFLLAYGTVSVVRNAYGQRFSRFDEVAFHPLMFALCAGLAVFAGVLAALAPAWNAAREAQSLQASVATHATRRSHLSNGLVVVEVAMTCLLLLTTGLFLRSYQFLAHAPFGFDLRHTTGVVLMPNVTDSSPQILKAADERVVEKFLLLPGVEAAANTTTLPYSRFMLQFTSSFHFAGEPYKKDAMLLINIITPGYQRAMGMPVRRGRALLPGDAQGAQPVCLVNEAFVREFLSHREPLNRTLLLGEKSIFYTTPRVIVGVMPDEIAYRSQPTLYLPFAQVPSGFSQAQFLFGVAPQFAVRSSLPQATLERELRAALKDAAPEYAEMSIGPLQDGIDKAFETQQLALRLAGGFGLIALALAAVGIYGVLSYSVAQRTREIGIRIALGSTRAGAMRLILRQAAFLVAAGLLLGLAGAWPAGQAVRSFLFGVTPLDPLTLLATAMILLLVAAGAAASPALRATQVDPMEALRSE